MLFTLLSLKKERNKIKNNLISFFKMEFLKVSQILQFAYVI